MPPRYTPEDFERLATEIAKIEAVRVDLDGAWAEFERTWQADGTAGPSGKEHAMNLPTDVWLPAAFDVTSEPGKRDPALYRRVVEQLDVLRSPRYQARGGNTFCNVAAADVCAAMGADLPYWVGPGGEKASVSDQFFEANANWLAAWLGNDGHRHGWARCSPEEAVAHAKQGQPTVVCWLNWRRPDRKVNALGSGHIAMVIPSDQPGVRIAQAGASNLFDADVAAGFGSSRLPLLNYYWHP